MVERALLNSELAIRAELRFRAASNTEVTYTIDLFYPENVEDEDVATDVQEMRVQLTRELGGEADANQELAQSFVENIAGDDNYGAPPTIGEADVSTGLIGGDAPTNDDEEEPGEDTDASVLVPAIVVPVLLHQKYAWKFNATEAANIFASKLVVRVGKLCKGQALDIHYCWSREVAQWKALRLKRVKEWVVGGASSIAKDF
eukprot:1140482-Pelagomonas_calceolata.AAC.1